MKIMHKPLIRDNSNLEELTSQEQHLWNGFETDDNYRFLTGEPDTVPEFHFNWTSVPRLQPLGHTMTVPGAPAPAPAPAQEQCPQVQQPPSDPSSSGSSSSSSPHSSPSPSTSGNRPSTGQSTTLAPVRPDPSGASTSGTTPPYGNPYSRNLRQQTEVDYKDLHTGAPQFCCRQFWERCSQAGALVQKSVAKVRKCHWQYYSFQSPETHPQKPRTFQHSPRLRE
jgi:hypothetical protein